MGSNRSRRLLALLLVAACTGLAACGGDDEPPDTQVVVPEETATPEAADASATPSVDGYLISVNQRRLVLRTQQGEETFRISLADLPTLGLPHLQSHAGITSIGFRVFYQQIGGKRFVKGAVEIAPPF